MKARIIANPRTPLPRRRGQETRQAIVDAASAVFVRRGYGAASVDEIIAQADISKGAFYHHFASKEALFQVLLADRARGCTERMADAIVSGASVSDNVRSILHAGWAFLTSDPAWAGIQMEFWIHATSEEWAQQAMADSLRECRHFLSHAIATAQGTGRIRDQFDPDVAARLMLALSDGIMVQWQIDRDELDPQEFVPAMANMITRYLTCIDESPEPRRRQRS